jgi:hypothetical protein
MAGDRERSADIESDGPQGVPPSIRFSMWSILFVMFLLAGGITFFAQQRSIYRVENELRQQAWGEYDARLPIDSYRLLVKTIPVDDHTVLTRIRIETNKPCAVRSKSASSTSMLWTRARQGDRFCWAEMTVFVHATDLGEGKAILTALDQLQSPGGLVGAPNRRVLAYGGAMSELYEPKVESGVHKLGTSVDLFTLLNETMTLNVK